jgi:hypothetical protein
VSGFYPVNMPASGGSFSVTSFSGAVLGSTKNGAGEVSCTITPPDSGKAVDFGVSVPNLEEVEPRWIVLSEDGQLRIRGAAKRQPTSLKMVTDPVSV